MQRRRIASLKSKSSVNLNSTRQISKPVNTKLSVLSCRKRPTTAEPNFKSNQVKPCIKKCSEQKPLQNKLPSLPYQLADEIIQLVDPYNLTSENYHLLRELGSGWRLVIDNVYLPVFHKPASAWNPYMEDRGAAAVLTRSYGKFFKLSHPLEFQLLQRLCKIPGMGFPAKELKIWCDSAPVQLLRNVAPSLEEVSKHIWSFTFVLGETLESVRLLYGVLVQMTNLEDLRVICLKKEMEIMQREIKPPYPQLSLPYESRPNLVCLSLSGHANTCVLDDLLECYENTLECFELSGHFLEASQVLGPNMNSDLFPCMEKLKISTGDNYTLETFSNKAWPLRSISINWNWASANSQRKYATLGKILEWLEQYESTLTEVYLYIGCPPTPEPNPRNYHEWLYPGWFPNIRKIGFPYMLAVTDIWIIEAYFFTVSEIEFHDWSLCLKVEERNRKADAVDLLNITLRTRELWFWTHVNRISVLSGKTKDTEIYMKKRVYRYR